MRAVKYSILSIFLPLGVLVCTVAGTVCGFSRETKLAVEDIPEAEKTWDVEEDISFEELIELEMQYSVLQPEKEEPVVTLPKFPNKTQLKIIGRLAEGIYKWKAKVRKGEEKAPYFDCGKRYVGKAAKDRALLWAFNIVKSSSEAGENNGIILNPWGVAGTVANESAFDLCAFGTYPRKAAYGIKVDGKPLLKKSRLTVSHTYEDVVKAIQHPKLKNKFKTYDLGGLQVLALYYSGPMEKLLTWEGFDWQVRWMAKKSRLLKTKQPWAYWPGHYALWKHERVVGYARKLGAKRTELK